MKEKVVIVIDSGYGGSDPGAIGATGLKESHVNWEVPCILFKIDSLYRKMPKKPFIRGRKQEFEILMMYYWIHSIDGDEEDYWQEYLNKAVPSLRLYM